MCNVFPQAQFVNRDRCWQSKGERPRPLTPNRRCCLMILVTPLAN